ncbi:MAG: branched-chain amino acid ABC transporter permease [Coriobacteriia bacterium]|nr:branched-chain amino acid ABC transporter permease [Coriobacteriia bacterium]
MRATRMRYSIRAAVILALTFGVAITPFVMTDRYILRILTFVGINLIMVAGLSLLFGYAGQISLGQAAFYGLGAYTSGYLAKAGVPWLLALVGGVAVAAIGGLLIALPSLRLKGHYLAMATLGFGEIMLFFFTETESVTGGSNGLRGIPAASIGPLEFATPVAKYFLVWSVVGIVLVLAANIVRRRPGRALRAIHGSETGAQACGIDTVKVKIQVFVLSAGLGGLAGVLYAHYVGFVSPSTFTLHYSLILVTMVALGGMGSLGGAVAGTVLLTLLPYVDAIIPGLPRSTVELIQDWTNDIYGMVLILVMLFMPRGLAGWATSLVARFGGRDRAGGSVHQGGGA